MSSLSLPPDHRGQGARFIDATFKTKALPPPASTTFADQTTIITGSNTGLGLRCAEIMLDLHLTHLIMAVRSIAKGEKAAAALREAHPDAKIEVWELDMLSYDSVRNFAKRCESLPRLDIALLNAGYWEMDSWKVEPSTGHETTLQVNYLSTALLAFLLLPVLKRFSRKGRPSRLSIVSSGLALASQFTNRDAVPLILSFDQLEPFSITAGSERYSTTKTMECMFVWKLSQFVNADEVIVNAVDPGFTKGTALHRDAKGVVIKGLSAIANTFFARSPTQGAWCYIDGIAVKAKDSHGSFVMNWQISCFHSMMYTPEGKQTTERLWDETLEELDFAGVRNIADSLRS
ncbi:hypothetical protein LTR91_000075 [Friedmanniomyces endolithicus]|uniref:Short-chain dehydrogenase/reductase family protein n=1 Tax=Friedmanniomyces endolithicus TaxID=329885 RepID=A0AAN6FQL2_9PEZI|nr:hypothetical protein LTR35_001510 [Friedmanniomyces endolithicus]KAK0297995.1 hypothetical protein LTS00_003534 [Friedmanniomyces endolithicus]KAK0310085.1 hypothetical protein LTR01_004284 [Friedmanniomyces endolithicus]KAK0322640.1 hypothetical protein LTR82_006600 [Friedmanniomyces endolithicus]KAK0826362.1 hypothetical protein LTR73_006226 [Friedmanniomyces endolithicus]